MIPSCNTTECALVVEILAGGGCALVEWRLERGRTHQKHGHVTVAAQEPIRHAFSAFTAGPKTQQALSPCFDSWDLLDDTESFSSKIVGIFVRIRISGANQNYDIMQVTEFYQKTYPSLESSSSLFQVPTSSVTHESTNEWLALDQKIHQPASCIQLLIINDKDSFISKLKRVGFSSRVYAASKNLYKKPIQLFLYCKFYYSCHPNSSNQTDFMWPLMNMKAIEI
ncbi:hypothetical protein R6Q59_033147 [Mikania micrantha]